MRNSIFFLLLIALGSCSSDDSEPCDTLQPEELLQGEGRIAVTWRDITEGQVITEYQYQLVLQGDAPDGAFQSTNAITVSSSPNTKLHLKTINSLPFDTEFDLYYKAVCGTDAGETLGPIALRSLDFGEGCTPPADLELIEVTTTTAAFVWLGFDEIQWRISWGANDGEDGGEADVSDTAYTITGLRPGVAYAVGVRALCSNTDFVQSQIELNPSQTVTTLEE